MENATFGRLMPSHGAVVSTDESAGEVARHLERLLD
jgi:hypothetical protein